MSTSICSWQHFFNERHIIFCDHDNQSFILNHLLDTQVFIYMKNSKEPLIFNSNKLYLINCLYFKYQYQFNNIFTIKFDTEFSLESLELFFLLLHCKKISKDNKAKIKCNLLELHSISDYLMNEEIKVYCENNIAKLLNGDNFWTIFTQCLDETSGIPYKIIPYRSRLFRYLILWLNIFYKTSLILPKILFQSIENYQNYDIIKNEINYYSSKINISLYTNFCTKCKDIILLKRFIGFCNKQDYCEVFDLLLIRDSENNNHYKLSIQRNFYVYNTFKGFKNEDVEYIDFIVDNPFKQIFPFIKTKEINFEEIDDYPYNNYTSNEYSSFNLSIFIVQFIKNNVLLSPICLKSEKFQLRQDQSLIFGTLKTDIKDSHLDYCNSCKNHSNMYSFGFKFTIFKY